MKKYVNTNLGLIPLDAYLNMMAKQAGYDNYETMLNAGHSIQVSKTYTVIEDTDGSFTVKAD